MNQSNKPSALFAAICLSGLLSANSFAAESETGKIDLEDAAKAPISLTLPEVAEEKKLTPRLPLNELRVFAEVFNRVSEAYVEEIDDKELLENAIKGMLSQLDPHSAYLDLESFNDLQENTSGNYGVWVSKSLWKAGFYASSHLWTIRQPTKRVWKVVISSCNSMTHPSKACH